MDLESVPPMLDLPPDLLARYQVHDVIGTGGMSTVYRAHDPLLRRDVAIKVFTARADEPGQLQIQQAEAHLVASMNHHALTTLFDAGVDVTDPSRPRIYLVMEHIVGSDLRGRVLRGPLDPLQVCWLGFDLCDALDYVHEVGIVHHDIKPANVLLAERRADTRIRGKLTDFGIAALIGSHHDHEFVTGTAAYLAPEQVEGEDAAPASDVYALGLVLIEALTGRVAFPGELIGSALARLNRQPRIPDTVPSALSELLRLMTARSASDRITAAEAARRFGALVVESLVEHDRLPPVEPSRETERLAALHDYGILDTPSDDAFDPVTRLAGQLLRVPIAMVTITDIDRVWVKSRIGTELDEIDRNASFCAVTASDQLGPWTIPDTLEDHRLAGNSLVTGAPHVRSYAAAPLITRDGHVLGSLCVFDHEPRHFTEQELLGLADLAGLVMRELELRLASRRAIFARSLT